MQFAIDTNVMSALWSREAGANRAQQLLYAARQAGNLVVCGPVFAELIAYPGTTVEFVDRFLRTTDIAVDVDLDRDLWQNAGKRFAEYAIRRRESGGDIPRRILADFVIGAHAASRTSGLISFNGTDYRNAFPKLRVIATAMSLRETKPSQVQRGPMSNPFSVRLNSYRA